MATQEQAQQHHAESGWEVYIDQGFDGPPQRQRIDYVRMARDVYSKLIAAASKPAVHVTRAAPRRGLSRGEASSYIGVGTTMFDALVRDGRMPRPFHMGTRVLWDIRDLDSAIEAIKDDAHEASPPIKPTTSWDDA